MGNMVRAGVERSMVQLKKSKLAGTKKTGVVHAVLDSCSGPNHVGLLGHGREFGSFSQGSGELPYGVKQWSDMIVFAF